LPFLLALAASPAAAFPTGDRYDEDSTQSASGDGVHYTGGPASPATVCSVCHVDAPRAIGVRFGADDPTLFEGGYAPGHTYQLEVELTRESRGLAFNGPATCSPNAVGAGFVPCNTNGFGLEIDDVVGSPAGALCPILPVAGACPSATSASTQLSTDGAAIFNVGYAGDPKKGHFQNDVTRWTFFWTAPGSGSGPVTFNAGLVDGNGGLGNSAWPADVDGDDVVEAHLAIAEQGGAPLSAGAGCSAGRRRDAVPLLALAALCALLVGRRLTRKTRRQIA
jgi:hypothetical protein